MTPGFFGRSGRRSPPSGTPPLRPPPPLAKRLNRNALTVAAVIMGMTVLTAIVILRPSREVVTPSGTAAQPSDADGVPVPSRPTFLDQPAVLPTPPAQPTPPAAAPNQTDTSEHVRQQRDRSRGERADSTMEAIGLRDDQKAQGPVEAATTARQRAYLAAMMSPVLVGAPTPRAATATGMRDTFEARPDEESQLLALSDSILRSAARGSASSTSGGGPASTLAPSPPTSGDSRRTFMNDAGDSHGSTVLARLEPAGSPYTLRAGTVIPGVLLTSISSDLPGDIVGQVSRPVYDSRTQRTLLVPKGARLIGTYDNKVVAGQGRLLVAWTRLILPDGRSMRLPGLALKDAQGATGVSDKVDNHWRRVFGNALLLSAISAGVQLSQPQQSSVLASPSARQVAAGAVGQELSSVAVEILRRGMDVAPTISIGQGHPFNVFLNGDLVFDGPYMDEPASPRP